MVWLPSPDSREIGDPEDPTEFNIAQLHHALPEHALEVEEHMLRLHSMQSAQHE